MIKHIFQPLQALSDYSKKAQRKKEISLWLDSMAIEYYKIRSDFTVDVDSDVLINGKNLTSIPVQFGHVSGNFNCSENTLTSLQGSPQSVGQNFNCDHNLLTSLQYGPQSVGNINNTYQCIGNQIKNLKHLPQKFEGSFWCSENEIHSLEGCESLNVFSFYCDHNKIENLDFLPTLVHDKFYCDHNPLLGEAQDTTNFSEILKIKDDIKKIKDEKLQLDDLICPTSSKKSNQTYKI